PGTVVPWSPDFPRESKLPRGRPALWPSKYGLLRTWKQQGEQLGAALAVDDAVDPVRREPSLVGDHRLLLLGHVVAEALESQQESGVGPISVNQVACRARKRQAPPRQG